MFDWLSMLTSQLTQPLTSRVVYPVSLLLPRCENLFSGKYSLAFLLTQEVHGNMTTITEGHKIQDSSYVSQCPFSGEYYYILPYSGIAAEFDHFHNRP